MFKSIKKMVLGNGVAQGIQFGSLMLLSRLYLPSDFGFLAQVQAVAMFATVAATLQLHLVIPLYKEEDEAKRLVKSIQCLILISAALALPFLAITGWTGFLYLTLTISIALINTYSGYLVYKGSFNELSRFYIIRAILIVSAQFFFSFINIEHSLIIATVIAELLASLYLRCLSIGLFDKIKISYGDLKKAIISNKAFTLYGTIQELTSVTGFYAPLFLFSIYFDSSITGQFAMANRLVWAPTGLISKNVAQVIYHKAAILPPCDKHTLKNYLPNKFIIIVSAVVCAGCFLLVEVFHLILGGKWELASRIIPIQLLGCAFFLFAIPFRVICRVLRMQKIQMAVDLVVLIFIAIPFVFFSFTPIALVWWISLLMILQNLALSLIVWTRVTRTSYD